MSTASIGQCTGPVRCRGENPAGSDDGPEGIRIMTYLFGQAGRKLRAGFEVIIRPEVDELVGGKVVEQRPAAAWATAGGQHPADGQRDTDDVLVGRLRAVENRP